MAAREEFLDEVEQFLRISGLSPTKLGTGAVGDPTFVFELRSGRSPNLNTVEPVRAFMRTWAPPQKPRRPPEAACPTVAWGARRRKPLRRLKRLGRQEAADQRHPT